MPSLKAMCFQRVRRRLAAAIDRAVVLALIFFVPLAAASPHPRWKSVGPGGGGSLFLPTISPHDANRVLVASDMTGIYVSDNGGQDWRMFDLGARAHFLVFDPGDSKVIYAGSNALWRSTDNGKNWKLVYPDPATVEGVAMADDHASETILSRQQSGIPAAFAVDPSNSDNLYLAVQKGASGALYFSPDRGKRWRRIGALPDGARQIYVAERSRATQSTVYVIANSSVEIREKGRWLHKPAPQSADPWVDVSGGFDARGQLVVYAATKSSVLISPDGGRRWKECKLWGAPGRLRAVATSLHHPDTAYVSYSGLRQGFETYFGVEKTSDRGGNWEAVWKESKYMASNIDDAWISRTFGPGYAGNPLNLGVAPDNPHLAYETDMGRAMRTSNGGKTWSQVYSTAMSDDTYSSRGLDPAGALGVHFDPFDRKRIFVSYIDIGLFRSENGGLSWASSMSGVPPAWWNTAYWMVFDPQVRGRVWAVMSGIHDLPRAKVWHRRDPSHYEGGVCISEDGGRTWRASSVGMAPTAATHILLDPASPRDARVLYVAAFGRGVYKSLDGGETWRLKINGISSSQPFAWRLARDSRGTLYLVVVRRNEASSDGDGALYRSSDGAEHWTKIRLPRGVNGPNGLVIDPEDDNRLYLAAWARNVGQHGEGGGVYISNNGGKTWRCVLSRDQHVYDVTVDPRDPRIIYAAGFESSAWRSNDRGETWTRLSGFNFKWGHRVIPDLGNPKQVYVTTFGGGVWHGSITDSPHRGLTAAKGRNGERH